MSNPVREGYREFENEPEPGDRPAPPNNTSTLQEDTSLFHDRTQTENSLSPEQAFIHMVKAMLGTGLLSLPLAFKHSGLFLGLILTILICLICLYCMRQVVFLPPILFATEMAETSSITRTFCAGPWKWVLLGSDATDISSSNFSM
ncbi:unnamed protein product [Caenorhabditis auriculariae]|uniref:Amino acid transporter transmembrane domain-containing protein n=1 Tax=Caenorhabditis auriculariae TaxID=2777116 RepID=A0A8S1GSX1_9PELO|nr:unnamed protein product [Caenorhabditis auriculariae]